MREETEAGASTKGCSPRRSPTLGSRAHVDLLVDSANAGHLERIALAQDRGEIRADVDAQTLIDMLYGAIY